MAAVREDPTAAKEPLRPRSGLDRALGVLTQVRPGEAPTALLLTLAVFLLLTAYYVIKPVREGLILELKSGAEYKSYMGGAVAVALLVLVPAYAAFAKRVAPNRLVVGVTLFFASHLLLFYFGSSLSLVRQYLGLVFYVWVGVFNMMLVAQFWAFANDVYTEEQGKRLFPLVGVGASVGAAAGSQTAAWLAQPLGRYPLLLVSAGLLVVSAALVQLVHRRESHPGHRAAAPAQGGPRAPAQQKAASSEGAFALVARTPYLRSLAAFSLLFTIVNSNGEYLLAKLFKSAAAQAVAQGELSPDLLGDYLTAAFGSFYFYVNVLGVLLQALVVSRLVRYGGLRVAFLVLPVVALLGSVALAALPVLAVLKVTKTAENAADYSINNTVRNMLWLPTTREMKYVAKQAVDTFFVRMGDVSSALLVALGAQALSLTVRGFALINVALVLGWLALAWVILRQNRELSSRRVAA